MPLKHAEVPCPLEIDISLTILRFNLPCVRIDVSIDFFTPSLACSVEPDLNVASLGGATGGSLNIQRKASSRDPTLKVLDL